MWKYEQATGRLFDADGKRVAKGYAGAVGHVNKPESQELVGKGPCPVGIYDIDPPHTSTKTGPYVMNMIPHPDNVMFGRYAFQIHGDSVKKPGTASNGCLIFARAVRELIWNSGDHTIEVVTGK